MVTGWKRAFCTSIPKERETTVFTEKQQQKKQQHGNSNTTTTTPSTHSPRIISKFGFFSNPSTPRLKSQSVSSPGLWCRTTTATTPTSSVPDSPKLQCKTATIKKCISPRFFHFSNSSSPKSPSSFSLLKASLRLSKTGCGICLQSVKSGQGTAIFTAECSHVFHFSCVAAHMKKQQLLICPVCSATWKELPLLSIHHKPEIKKVDEKLKELSKIKNLRIYNDDEPLMSPSSGSLFNPIPELEETDVEDDDENTAQEFQGFFVNPRPVKVSNHVKVNAKNVEVSLLPDSALLTVGRSSQTQVVVLKVKAPPPSAARRLPIDLVTVLDVSEMICRVKSQMMKRVMRLLISSLNSNDRLSIVVFSATSKRLLPLRRMTAEGRRSARRIVEALQSIGRGMSAHDGLKKAAKVIEDRREKNPVASIIIISNGQDDRSYANSFAQKRSSRMVSSTRFSHLEIPVHSIGLGDISACKNSPPADALAKCAGRLLSVVVQDLKLQLGFISGSAPAQIAAVYSLTGRPSAFGAGSVWLGDLHAEEERELLVEMKVPTSSIGSHHVLSVQSSFKDPSSQEPILSKEKALLIPRPQTVRSSVPNIQRLKDLHITTRAIAESQRLTDHNDLSGAYHLLSSARALVMQSSDGSTIEHLRSLEAELGELHRRRQQLVQSQKQKSSQQAEEKPEPLTPTSAWRAAERLAKVAIMRKHMNRVSDLHGFENARF
ncbi:hypothetical protein P3X46_012669 [Hevea brasiliensis]|uniref:RING-type domain-containing protein n=1 Tax=Hevea brasiliensis TaxID=3981 RepID=A0ABQ9MAZ0_HEVBR|nr:probable E3 ubiquitin-protein ligase EDA40 [Hevea brasiliensis]KAJ9177449.1 hypothetical protein P3X46_012669 [Hevea brasiliensis]